MNTAILFACFRRGLRCGSVVLAIMMTTQGARAADAASSDGWRALPLIEDGKVAARWRQVGWGGFTVDDGTLRTAPAPQGLGLLVFQGERFGNCQIRVVFKALNAKSNAGVYVRMADGIVDRVGEPGAAFQRDEAGKISPESMERMKVSADRNEGAWFAVHHGYEVQIADSGDALHRTGAIYSLAGSSSDSKPGQWRTMIITLNGERIAVELDGKQVSQFDPAASNLPPRKQWYEPKREPKRPVSGLIGLQNHDPGDTVWFKEVSVRPLPAHGGR